MIHSLIQRESYEQFKNIYLNIYLNKKYIYMCAILIDILN